MTRVMTPFRAVLCSTALLLVVGCGGGDGPSEPQVPVASVEVTPSPASVPVGGMLQLTATTKDAAANVLTGRLVTWASSDEAIATVSQTGLVEGVAEGPPVTITATSEAKSGTASITVQVAVASVAVTPASASVARGGTLQLTATLRDAAGNILIGRTITWSSSDEAIASVSPTGLLTGVAAGIASISASSEGKSDLASITVVVTNFSYISAGRFHSCSITSSGTGHCWGSAEDGQLGDGSSGLGVLSAEPVAVSGALTFDMITGGGAHSCGISGVSALCWGSNADGQLGSGTGADAATPAVVTGGLSWAAVSAGMDHTCGLTTTGGAWCWGLNEFGQLGDGTTGAQTAPVAVSGALTFASTSAGDEHACALDTTGAAHCWGRGTSGQLGDGTGATSFVPVAVFGGLTFTSLSAGGAHSCGLTSAGAAYCWGDGGDGQLGNGTNADSNLPVAVSGGLTFAALSAGGNHTCGVTSTGAAYCWGRGEFGQIGNGISGAGVTLTTPTPVSGGLTFASVEAGDEHSCGVLGTGEGYCWGRGTFGRLGNSALVDRTTPVRVVDAL